jgi:crotonobetainyl-CoA:carnitine CoA-transferase CaiB-like acyl-CoA transferase
MPRDSEAPQSQPLELGRLVSDPSLPPSEDAQALAGVRAISFGAFVAGNTSALLLAELGADVVKVEARARPEVLRTPAYAIGDTYTEPSGVTNTVMHGALSRSVRGLSIDLANPEARPLFHRLAGTADVVIENFGGSTLARWGCSFEDLVADNPRLVMLSLSGYGQTGPRTGYLAYASNICGYVGLTSAWGYSHGTHSDYITAATAGLAAVAALRQVAQTGQPIHLDVAQIDAMVGVMAPLLVDPLVNGKETSVAANAVPGSWLSGVFACLGHDRWVAIEVEDGEDWSRLCQFLDRPDLDAVDARAADYRRPELEAAVAEWTARVTPHTATHLLQKAGVAAGTVQDSEDIWRDPQLRSRGFMVPLEQPDFGVVNYPRSVHRLSRTPGRIRRPAPRLGQHSNEILREWLGVTDDELAGLAASGAIFDAHEPLRPLLTRATGLQNTQGGTSFTSPSRE